MTKQLYDLRHPLYPHPDLLNYYLVNKAVYSPTQGSKDDEYKNWYRLVREDSDISGAPPRPITREVSQIIRLKVAGKDYLMYSETLTGQDHEFIPRPFFHTYGSYVKPGFRRLYNYDTQTATIVTTGQLDTVYFIEYNPQLIDELYNAGADNQEVELLVNVGDLNSKQYGGRGFYTLEEFRNLPLDDLARIGRDGKGMFKQITSKVSTNEIASENFALKMDPRKESELYQEFQAFKKFRAGSQNPQNETITVETTKTTVKENKESKK